MKTLLIVLGSLFVLSRLQGGQGLTLTIGAGAPAGGTFHPTPAAGGAASIIPPGGDPYGFINNLPAGGGGGGITPSTTVAGSSSGRSAGGSARQGSGGFVQSSYLSHVSRGGNVTLQ